MFNSCSTENIITHAEITVFAMNRSFSDADMNTHFGFTCIPPIAWSIDDESAKGHECEPDHLKALLPQRDSNDGEAEDKSVYRDSIL